MSDSQMLVSEALQISQILLENIMIIIRFSLRTHQIITSSKPQYFSYKMNNFYIH